MSPGLADLIRKIRDLGLKVKLGTNGSRPEVLADLLKEGLLDKVAMDVKAPLDEVSYARAVGRTGFLASVNKSLELLRCSGVSYTLRTTVVPGLHSESDVFRLAEQVSFAPEWKLQEFNPENALDCSFRHLDPWDPDAFNELSVRALAIQGRTA